MAWQKNRQREEAGGGHVQKKFECDCRTTSSRIAETTSKIEAGEAALVQLKRELKGAELSCAEAKESLASAGELDAKAASALDAESSYLAANIDALTRAIAALEKGAAGSSLLQSGVVSSIRKLTMKANRVSDEDRSTFLLGGDRQGYAPQKVATSLAF